MQVIRNKKGDFTLNGAVNLIVIAILMLLFISVVGVLLQIGHLQSVSSELTRYIEIRGEIGDDTWAELDRLSSVGNMDGVELEVEASYLPSSSSKIQFGESFVITLRYTDTLSVGGIVEIPIPIEASVTGRSEKYWK